MKKNINIYFWSKQKLNKKQKNILMDVTTQVQENQERENKKIKLNGFTVLVAVLNLVTGNYFKVTQESIKDWVDENKSLLIWIIIFLVLLCFNVN